MVRNWTLISKIMNVPRCFFVSCHLTGSKYKFKQANTELMPSEEDKLAVIVSHVSCVLLKLSGKSFRVPGTEAKYQEYWTSSAKWKLLLFLLFKWPCRLWKNSDGGEEEETTEAYERTPTPMDMMMWWCDVKKTKQGNGKNDGTDVTKKGNNDEDGVDSFFPLYFTALVMTRICCMCDIVVERWSASYKTSFVQYFATNTDRSKQQQEYNRKNGSM